MIIVSPVGVPLVPADAFSAIGTFEFLPPPCASCECPYCGRIRELLGPAVLDLLGTPIPSAIVVLDEPPPPDPDTPEPATLASLGLALFASLAARVGAPARALVVGAAVMALSAPANAAPVHKTVRARPFSTWPGAKTLSRLAAGRTAAAARPDHWPRAA